VLEYIQNQARNYIMTTTKPTAEAPKEDTDFDKFVKERNAAIHMRDELCFLVGWTSSDNPEIAKKLEDILDKHDENRVQNWF
jgi:hypothetical protein